MPFTMAMIHYWSSHPSSDGRVTHDSGKERNFMLKGFNKRLKVIEAALSDSAQSGSAVNSAYYHQATSLPSGATTALSWGAAPYGDGGDLFDLTDPTKPLALADGLYIVSTLVGFTNGGGNAGKNGLVELDFDYDGDGVYLDTTVDLAPAYIPHPQVVLAMSYHLLEGQALWLGAFQNTGSALNIQMRAAVAFIAGSPPA